ncbi:CNH domain-containing protein [Calycina marina]|uniref:CNH domain-containing protein n=1 Tax=Calycina marina TaxID=1763456 RepID=A0A9P8CG67_9HELO|nr:CNH domain-containing protein [Calycina marina]
MADYSRSGSGGPRPNEYGHNALSNPRADAYSHIFGAAPPPGRSQTMNSSIAPPGPMSVRTQTMNSSMGSMPRPPPQRPQGGGYQSNGNITNAGSMSNGYLQQIPRQSQQNYSQVNAQPQPNMLPNGMRAPVPDRRPYNAAQRMDPRAPPPPPQPRPPQQIQPRYYGSTGGGGMLPNGSQPALNSDPYRSQSMASGPRPQMYSTQQGYSQAPANAFRQSPYQNHSARQTAQGRVVPERGDERTMSMTTYTPDRDHQTASGRVIPNRRMSGSGVHELGGYSTTPSPRSSTSQTRSPSITSSTVVGDMSRSMSMASTIVPNGDNLQHRPSVAKSVSSGTGRRQRAPMVYPALLSRVAECFRDNLQTGDRAKNGLQYKNAFSGAEAVQMISYIIQTTDSNLALLLGRALDAQKFFHDVTYDHRLRDSQAEMYQFRETMMDDPSETTDVNGVFVLLSECYSPTCTRDQLCYSIACPRRLEQQSRLNLKPQPGLRKQEEEEVKSLHDDAEDKPDEQKLWINTVSQEVANSVGDREKKRQEVISELMYTERDFVKDLEYLRDFWILPLRSKNPAAPSPIPELRKGKVVKTIFTNIIDSPSLHAVSSRFAEALTERQKKTPVVHNIGDIFLQFIPQFEPFITYGSLQLQAKFEFENERNHNAAFSQFVELTERNKASRKLELNGYLTKPTTRLARYPLLLENVAKYTEPGNSDVVDIEKAIVMIRDLLARVNHESGKAENKHNLVRLHQQLRFRPNERVDLKLTDEGRELIFKGGLKRQPTDNVADIQAYLFDHAMLLVRVKESGKKEEFKAYRKPIPLELLVIREMEEVVPKYAVRRPTSNLMPGTKATAEAKKNEYPITFRSLGKGGYEATLYATTLGSRKKLMGLIGEQQMLLRKRGNFYNKSIVSNNFFSASNRVNCLTPFDGGRKLIYGTDSGVYVSDRRAKDETSPSRVIDIANVTQIDVLEEYQLLLVLSQKTLFTYPLSALDSGQPIGSKKPKKIQNHCNFFKMGVCLGKHLVCCVKSSALSTTIKVFEPNDAISKGKKQKGFSKIFKDAEQDELKPFKEFYIPTESSSIHFLKTKLCVACAKGFEVVSLETLETQSLLDQADTSLDFVAKKENARPVHIERLNGEFLLNYTEFSFFVNRNGWRARPDWRIDWEGSPVNFALSYPWILGFEPSFIEIRNIETCAVHIVPHANVRMLHTSTREILYAYTDESTGSDNVVAIDFWPADPKVNHRAFQTSCPATSSRR